MKYIKPLTTTMERMFQNDLRFTKGATHCHTQNSEDDGFSSEIAMCEVPKQLGATKAVISDHGTAMGWDDFDDAAKKVGITPVFGIEVYFQDDVTLMNSHEVLYAKNAEGMRQIRMAMSRAKILEDGRHVLTDETLEMLRGGNVIATSACINGVFGSIVLYNDRIDRKIAKLKDEIADFADSITAYEEAEAKYKEANERFSILRTEVSEARAASKKSFTGKQKQLDGMRKKIDKAIAAFDKFLADGKETSAKSVRVALAQLEVIVEESDEFQNGIEEAQQKYNQRAAQMRSEIAQTNAVAAQLDVKTFELETAKNARAAAKEILDAVAKDVAKVESRQAKIEEFESQKLTSQQSKELFARRLAQMLDVFGKDFYMEVQYHGLELEAKIYPWLANVARSKKIPIIAANDAHMAANTDNDVRGRQIRRSCRFQKWEEETEDMTEYYIKTDRELALALFQILPEDVVIEAMTNVAKVLDQCNATIDKESHAPKAKGIVDVKAEMIKIARANIAKKYGNTWGQKHEERFNYEVEIIDSMGFNDYFIITWDILNIARQIGGLSYERLEELKTIMNDMDLNDLLAYVTQYNTEPNISVGLGRGSGAGSIVCYLLGITNIDPFKYDLLFERKKDCVH